MSLDTSAEKEQKKESYEWKPVLVFLLVLCFCFFAFALYIFITHDYTNTSKYNVGNMALDIVGMVSSIILLTAIERDKSVLDEISHIFAFSVGLVIVGFFMDFTLCIADGNKAMYTYSTVGRFLYFSLTFLIYEMFWDFLTLYLDVKETQFSKIMTATSNILWIIMTLAVFINFLFGFMYSTTINNMMVKERFYWTLFFFPIFISLISIINTALSKKETGSKITLFTVFTFDIALFVLQGFRSEYHLLYLAMFVSILAIYSNIFADRGRQIKQKELELTNQKFAVMLSQIQPHFLYNSLSTIRYLIRKDPVTAEASVIKFSDYLRTNLDSLKKSDMIPLKKELDHVDNYLFLEKLRFAENLNIEYELEAEDFEVPAISIQPLVENAVKHGIQAKEGGGTVVIATQEYPTYYEISVSDNGVGFDMEAIKNDGKNHIGMENVRQRIKNICKGTLDVTSEVGKGTVSTIRVPKLKSQVEQEKLEEQN